MLHHNNGMKSLNFKWYDIVILSILGLALISAFIPFNPKTSEEGVTTFYSLLTFTATMFPNNGWKYLFLFILFVLFILGTAILFIFKQKIFSKITLMGAAVAIMFYAEKNSPVNIYSTVVAIVLLVMLLAILIVEGFKNRRDIANRATEEKNNNQE